VVSGGHRRLHGRSLTIRAAYWLGLTRPSPWHCRTCHGSRTPRTAPWRVIHCSRWSQRTPWRSVHCLSSFRTQGCINDHVYQHKFVSESLLWVFLLNSGPVDVQPAPVVLGPVDIQLAPVAPGPVDVQPAPVVQGPANAPPVIPLILDGDSSEDESIMTDNVIASPSLNWKAGLGNFRMSGPNLPRMSGPFGPNRSMQGVRSDAWQRLIQCPQVLLAIYSPSWRSVVWGAGEGCN